MSCSVEYDTTLGGVELDVIREYRRVVNVRVLKRGYNGPVNKK